MWEGYREGALGGTERIHRVFHPIFLPHAGPTVQTSFMSDFHFPLTRHNFGVKTSSFYMFNRCPKSIRMLTTPKRSSQHVIYHRPQRLPRGPPARPLGKIFFFTVISVHIGIFLLTTSPLTLRQTGPSPTAMGTASPTGAACWRCRFVGSAIGAPT